MTKLKLLTKRLKHLRGRHDQLDHAWNRGMGRGSGGGVGDIVTVEQYQDMSKKLDEEVAAGEITQQIADLTRKTLQKKANDYYDAVTRASLGMARRPRRQRASAQLADARANDIASAAQQGQYANVPKDIADAPAYSIDINDWKRWIDSFLPNDIDAQYREAIINGDRSAEKPDADIFIAYPVKLRKQAINDVARGYQDEPPMVTIGGARKREFPFPDLGQAELQNLIAYYDRLDKEFGFSKWKLTENETTQNAQDTAQRTVKRNQELLIERITLANEYEKKYTEYKSIEDVVRKLDVASNFFYDRAEEYESRIQKTGKKPNDTESNVIKKMREVASSLYNSHKLAKDAYFNLRPVLQQLSDDIAKSDDEVKLTSNGLRLSNQELDAFFDAHLGKSINPDMQQGRYYPSVDYDEEFDKEMEAKGVDLGAVVAYVRSFMSKYVDARLYPQAEIKFGSLDSPVDGPNYTDYDDTVYMVGKSSHMTASVLLHELAHAMEDSNPELQEITNAFYMSRVAKDPILSSTSDGIEYVKDDFPDWYCGLMGKTAYAKSVEILSMGMSMLFTDPVRFAKEHPEYFRLVTSALSGSWIKDRQLSRPTRVRDDNDINWNTQQSAAADISAQALGSTLNNTSVEVGQTDASSVELNAVGNILNRIRKFLNPTSAQAPATTSPISEVAQPETIAQTATLPAQNAQAEVTPEKPEEVSSEDNVTKYLAENDPNSVNDRTLINPALLPSIANAGRVLQKLAMSDSNFASAPFALKMLGLNPDNADDWQLFADLTSLYVSDDEELTNSNVIASSDGTCYINYAPKTPIAGKKIESSRNIRIDSQAKKVNVDNISFFSKGESQTRGIGHSMITRQVAAAQEIAKRLGYAVNIRTEARSDTNQGTSGSYNGYHTWPKLGYRFKIPYAVSAKLKSEYGFTAEELKDTATFFLSQKLINGKTPAEAWSDIINSFENEQFFEIGKWIVSDPDEPGLKILQQYNDKVRTEKNKSTSYGDEFGFSENDLAIYTDAWNELAKSQKTKSSLLKERLKHLRGRHDQRDHAWNRGMGRGSTSGGYAPGTMNQDQFMEMKRSLQSQIDSGAMSYEVGSAIWKRAQEIANQDFDSRPENRRDLARELISQSRADSIQQGAIANTLSNRTFEQRVQDLKGAIQGIRDTYADYLETKKAEEEKHGKPLGKADVFDSYSKEYFDILRDIGDQEHNLALIFSAKQFYQRNWYELNRGIAEFKYPDDYAKQDEEMMRLRESYDKKIQEYDERISLKEREIDYLREAAKDNPMYFKEQIYVPLRAKIDSTYLENIVTPEREAEIDAMKAEFEKAEIIMNSFTQNTSAGKREYIVGLINDFKKSVNTLIDTRIEESSSTFTPDEMMQRVAELAKQLRESPDTQKANRVSNKYGKLFPRDDPGQEYIDNLEIFLKTHVEFMQLANHFANAIEMMRQEARIPNEEGVIKWGAGESVVRKIFKMLKADNPIPVNFTESFKDPNELVGTRYLLDWRKEDVKNILSIVSDYSDVPYDVDFADYHPKHASAERESASYRNNKGVINQGRNTNFNTMVHETLHLIQLRFPFLQYILDDWAFDRIEKSGETPRKLSEITGHSGYDDNELSVVDQVDIPYTLKDYGGTYSEVLTTAFDRLSDLNFGTQDPEHIRIALYALLRYLPVPSKTKSLKERLKHLRGRHDQLDHAWNRGTGGGTVSGDDYQAAIKLLDQQVADGEINQEIADKTRAVLRKKANEAYDALTSASLGMARRPRRQRASAQLADARANDIASAAQQGQLANMSEDESNRILQKILTYGEPMQQPNYKFPTDAKSKLSSDDQKKYDELLDGYTDLAGNMTPEYAYALEQKLTQMARRDAAYWALFSDYTKYRNATEQSDKISTAKAITPDAQRPYRIHDKNRETFTNDQILQDLINVQSEMQSQWNSSQGGTKKNFQFKLMVAQIQSLKPEEQLQLITDKNVREKLRELQLFKEVFLAVAGYGEPDARMAVMEYAYQEDQSLYSLANMLNLEGLLLSIKKQKGQPQSINSRIAKEIIKRQISGNMGTTGAAVQQAYTQVGPNRDISIDKIRSFYPAGIEPPTPNPEIVAALQEMYEATQQHFENVGIDEVRLYRGGELQGGLPYEPWSTDVFAAEKFYKLGGTSADLRSGIIPSKYIVSYHLLDDTFLVSEKEYFVLSQSLYQDTNAEVDVIKGEPVNQDNIEAIFGVNPVVLDYMYPTSTAPLLDPDGNLIEDSEILSDNFVVFDENENPADDSIFDSDPNIDTTNSNNIFNSNDYQPMSYDPDQIYVSFLSGDDYEMSQKQINKIEQLFKFIATQQKIQKTLGGEVKTNKEFLSEAIQKLFKATNEEDIYIAHYLQMYMDNLY